MRQFLPLLALCALAQTALLINSPPSLPAGTVGTSYPPQIFGVTGGIPPYQNWKINGGALPPGLSLNAIGVLSGTPTTAGTFSFSPQVADSGIGMGQQFAGRQFVVTIAPGTVPPIGTVGPTGATGPQGPMGPAGPQGPTGAQGQAGSGTGTSGIPVTADGVAIGTATSLNILSANGIIQIPQLVNGVLSLQSQIDPAIVQTRPSTVCVGCTTLLIASAPATLSALSCVFMNNAAQVVINCTGPLATHASNLPLPIQEQAVGSFGVGPDSISWTFAPCPTTGTCWQVTSDGVVQTGSF